jgi:hypothetical protein
VSQASSEEFSNHVSSPLVSNLLLTFHSCTNTQVSQIFTRNKMIGWTAVIFAIQSWLGETPAQAASATTPSYLQVGMAAMSLGVVSKADA